MKNGAESPSLCALCGGECCNTRPGFDEPRRFLREGSVVEALSAALASGEWVLDRHYYVPGQPDEVVVLYPRPALQEEWRQRVLFTSGGIGPCVFLREGGCRLSFDGRPRMCRDLIPEPDFECVSSWRRVDAAFAWLPYQEEILEVVRRLQAPVLQVSAG